MMIKWKGDGLCAIPIITDNDNIQLLAKQGMEILLPGWNELDNDKFEKLLPSLWDYLENGKMETYDKVKRIVDEDTKEVTYTFEGKAMLDIRADVARNLIKECYNVHQLKKWQADPKIDKDFWRSLLDQITLCENGDLTAEELKNRKAQDL